MFLSLKGNFFIFIILFLNAGCSSWLHQRTFLKEMDEVKDGFFVPRKDFEVISGDTGKQFRSKREIERRTPLTHKKRKKRDLNNFLSSELNYKESRLSKRESRRYRSSRELFDSDSERIYYLNLPMEDRLGYLSRKRGDLRRLDFKDTGYSNLERRAIRKRQLFVGMTKGAVRRSWGSPEKVEYAGNPRMENEKWTFYHGRSRKNVFFESGIVQGWDF
ncbi:MAG: hypothetical protein CME68_07120 [Halobacteriovoraceae bacterium]|nr:hypothetical protein [Halobacteriovoraceae bacterium]